MRSNAWYLAVEIYPAQLNNENKKRAPSHTDCVTVAKDLKGYFIKHNNNFIPYSYDRRQEPVTQISEVVMR